MDNYKKYQLEKKYMGKTIRILDMVGEPEYVYKYGVVDYIDDIGQLHGTWGGLAIDLTCDKIEIVEGYDDWDDED
jgi:hypothetical protein